MGNILNYAITSSVVTRDGCRDFTIAAVEMQGFRPSMEDELVYTKSLSSKYPNVSVFGVFDGHGGPETSEYIKNHLLDELRQLEDPCDATALANLCLRLDQQILLHPDIADAGSTLVFSVVRRFFISPEDARAELEAAGEEGDAKSAETRYFPSTIPFLDVPLPAEQEKKKKQKKTGKKQQSKAVSPIAAYPRSGDNVRFEVTVVSVGDSSAFLVNETASRALPMTREHTVKLPAERARILAAGGRCEQGRVDGILAMTRAMGDAMLKRDLERSSVEQKVIAFPDVTRHIARPGDRLVLCCDGYTERMSVKQFVKTMNTSLKTVAVHDDPSKVLTALTRASLSKKSTDNHSAMLVSFLRAANLVQADFDVLKAADVRISKQTKSELTSTDGKGDNVLVLPVIGFGIHYAALHQKQNRVFIPGEISSTAAADKQYISCYCQNARENGYQGNLTRLVENHTKAAYNPCVIC
jgi:serine/threonine protein phosphatase PrpC